jgi:hypothetical protein
MMQAEQCVAHRAAENVVHGNHAVTTSDNRLGSCNAASGRYRRRPENRSLGKGGGHPFAHLSVSSRGVMNRQTLDETGSGNG